MARVLLIDDDPLFLQALRRGLELSGHETAMASNGSEGLENLVELLPDAVLLDLYLGQEEPNGLDILGKIRDLFPDLPVIIMTGYGTVENAVAAMKRGASEYVQKPLNIDEVLLLLDRTIEIAQLRQEVDYLRIYQAERLERRPLIMESEAMRGVIEVANQVAESDVNTVLLCGESGVGKDVIARFIHSRSGRRERPYVVVNCGALPADLVDIELFGCEQGGFPGALESRPGKFEMASGGTLLLDEIGAMSPENQVKLLRVLEDRRICRIGGRREVDLNVRVIATTNRDLERAVAQGVMRRDLFYRLNQVCITLPPLRERPEDILPLAEVFLEEVGGINRPTSIGPEVADMLTAYQWPGNARELRNMMERIVLLEEPDCLYPHHLHFNLNAQTPTEGEKCQRRVKIGDLVDGLRPGEVFDGMMTQLLVEAMERSGGNQAEASRWLGLSRSRMTYRMRYYGIDARNSQEHCEDSEERGTSLSEKREMGRGDEPGGIEHG
ncbi:MAG: sigma-54-dependent Fis family transcriptional regulator [Gemmatimonadetes bacterium]|nr:sigma-54-dependent Fis family transcriptional regulator [Gemmatimonadota bacterium]